LEKIAKDVMNAAQLAASLEVSATPKPGNVHRNADYPSTRFEHFLSGAVALGPAISSAASQGIKVGSDVIKYSEIGIGKYVKQAVKDVNSWHNGGNTHLGSIMLFTPLAAAAAILKKHEGKVKIDSLRKEATKVMESTTNEDALEFYGAISSLNIGWLGQIRSKDLPDIGSSKSLNQIEESGSTFFEIMKFSSEWDGIACELTNGLSASFKIGYPSFIKTYKETEDVNMATVNTFLKILSEIPDTFIARKIGLDITKDISEAVKMGMPISRTISEKSKKILDDHNGMLSTRGKKEIEKMDEELRRSAGHLNPGTTADITAASLMIALLTGFRV
jgi:triphosphoribosyl-dephospho-CoA synthase